MPSYKDKELFYEHFIKLNVSSTSSIDIVGSAGSKNRVRIVCCIDIVNYDQSFLAFKRKRNITGVFGLQYSRVASPKA